MPDNKTTASSVMLDVNLLLNGEVLTEHNQQKDEGGHSGCEEEHDSDVLSQFTDVLHVWHEHRREQEANSNAKLMGKK